MMTPLLDLGDRRGDIVAAGFHVVVGADANALDRVLRADDMLHCRDELGRQTAVGHQYQSNH